MLFFRVGGKYNLKNVCPQDIDTWGHALRETQVMQFRILRVSETL
jgi:hypothetical protein